jgi:hypothetical protein
MPPPPGLRTFRVLIFLVLLLLPGLLTGCTSSGDLSFPTEYQAVFLDNGQVFFGKLTHANSPFPTLLDVFFVQRVVSGENKEARNILMHLGSEWHGPDFMRINTRHILRIEPVAPDSQVARLIREAKKGQAATRPGANSPPSATALPGAAHQGEKKTSGARK